MRQPRFAPLSHLLRRAVATVQTHAQVHRVSIADSDGLCGVLQPAADTKAPEPRQHGEIHDFRPAPAKTGAVPVIGIHLDAARRFTVILRHKLDNPVLRLILHGHGRKKRLPAQDALNLREEGYIAVTHRVDGYILRHGASSLIKTISSGSPGSSSAPAS